MAVTVEIDMIDGLDLLAYVSFYEPYVLSATATFSAGSTLAAIADAPPGVADASFAGTSSFVAGGSELRTAAAEMAGTSELVAVSGATHSGAAAISGHSQFTARSASSANTEDEQLGRKVRVPKDPRSTKISGSGRRTSWR